MLSSLVILQTPAVDGPSSDLSASPESGGDCSNSPTKKPFVLLPRSGEDNQGSMLDRKDEIQGLLVEVASRSLPIRRLMSRTRKAKARQRRIGFDVYMSLSQLTSFVEEPQVSSTIGRECWIMVHFFPEARPCRSWQSASGTLDFSEMSRTSSRETPRSIPVQRRFLQLRIVCVVWCQSKIIAQS